MKSKTIKKVLAKKFAAFVESIGDPEIAKLVKENTIITGGCIASMLLREKVNDYDLYFRDRATAVAVAEHYIELFKKNPPPAFKSGEPVDIHVDKRCQDRVKIVIKSAGIAGEGNDADYAYFEQSENPDSAEAGDYVDAATATANESKDNGDYRPVFLSSNAITLSDKVQLVVRFFGEPDQLHENYDFVHCTNYWTSWDNELVLRKEALESLLAKELRYVGSKYPLCSIIRTRKFVARQWTINAGQFLKMAMQLNELNLKDLEVLADQLIGVDSAYFMDVIRRLKEKGQGEIEAAYLVEVIDRVF